MSIRAMLWVLDELKELPACPTLVMVPFADYADGRYMLLIAGADRGSGASERSVRRHLTWLQEQGLVDVGHRWAQRGAGRAMRLSSVYRLSVGKMWTPDGAPKKAAAHRVSAGRAVPDKWCSHTGDGCPVYRRTTRRTPTPPPPTGGSSECGIADLGRWRVRRRR
ncbi:hypothetical protein [Corynebacterium sp. CCM 9204]|uniref:hypothetical protein n=1 Tax=Corynebacterium sp. CCM 9204 TaxID=3057616 RepID=UPI0035246F07